MGLEGEMTVREERSWAGGSKDRDDMWAIGLSGKYTIRPFAHNDMQWTRGLFIRPGAGLLWQDENDDKVFYGQLQTTIGFSLKLNKTQLSVFTGPQYRFSKSRFFDSTYYDVDCTAGPTGRKIRYLYQDQGRGWYWETGISADWGVVGVSASMLFSTGESMHEKGKWQYIDFDHTTSHTPLSTIQRAMCRAFKWDFISTCDVPGFGNLKIVV